MSRSILGVGLLPLLGATMMLAQVAAKDSISLERRPAGSGQIVLPRSSVQRVEDLGLRAHTQFRILVPQGRPEGVLGFSEAEFDAKSSQPVSGYYAETPATLACLYGLAGTAPGCNPATVTAVAHGGARAIAVVDAYDYPTAASDLAAYSKQFGLATPNFTVAYQTTTKPGVDPECATGGGWNCWSAEAALDIEIAHALAPSAHLYLVEAKSSNNSDLYAAVTKAIALVQAAGGGEVSMSWGGSEYSTEARYDAIFSGANVVFFASSGDSEGTLYPAVSPNVVAVGGTTIGRNPYSLNFVGEYSWEDSGGGYSSYEPRPSYQNSIVSLTGSSRGVPDVAAVGNPRTGVWVYDSYDTASGGVQYVWSIFGGTSVASPLWAAAVNAAGHFSASTAIEQNLIYANARSSSAFRDITYGSCGYYEGWLAIPGWDPCTGNGSPWGTAGK